MKCIFCLQDRPPSDEHVFPLAIGGRLIIDRVCEPCNSALGSRVDAALSDNGLIRLRRSRLGLVGNSRRAPPVHEILLGKHKLTQGPAKEVLSTFNTVTGKLDLRVIPSVSDVMMPDGTTARQIIVDERDKDQIPKIIQRERVGLGLAPLSEAELLIEVEKSTRNAMSIENPQVHIKYGIRFKFLRHAMLKIAYELAFLWLGESYLDDPSATELRTAICSVDPESTDRIPAFVGSASDFEPFGFWAEDKNHHLATACVTKDGISIAVRIFDIYAANVWITKDAGQYLRTGKADEKLRFLTIDPVEGTMRNVSFMEEMGRVALSIIATRQQ